ncbi:MAG: CNNM domain-containing protein, partial [Planctomycetota bacterium]
MIHNLLITLLLLLVLLLSGVFAGSETGMYQLSSLRLRLYIERKRISFILLGKTMKNKSALLLSMLIGTNLSHYIITSIVTFLFLRTVTSDHKAELITTLVTAPVLFVFAELLPKTIFYHRADILMPVFSPILYIFQKVTRISGFVGLLRLMSNLFAKLFGITIPSRTLISTTQKSHIKAIFNETEEEGFLSSVQRDIFDRLARIPDVNIGSILTPISKVESIDKYSDKASLLNKLRNTSHTRLPVFEHWKTNIIGWIDIFHTLASTDHFSDLSSFIKPIRKLKAETDIISAIKTMQKEKLSILLVTKVTLSGREVSLGIVT